MSHESSPKSEIRIQISDEAEPSRGEQHLLSFSTPLTHSIAPIDDNEEKQHTISEKDEKKKQRKSMDDTKTKRKDTAITFTNFLHRLTRSEKDEKHKSTTSIAEETLLDRPNHLVLPDMGETWHELKTFATDQFRTALDMGNEIGMPVYEWKPDSLEEHLVTDTISMDPRNVLINMDFDCSEKEDFEKSLHVMLDDFRSGNMRSFSYEQLSAMRAAKQDHEEITNMHIALYSMDSELSDHDIETRLESVCDNLSEKMISMHKRLSNLVPSQLS